MQVEIPLVTPGIVLFVGFEKDRDGYHIVDSRTYADALDYPHEAYQEEAPYPPEEPEHVRLFVQNWLNTCEQAHATFGYFSHFPFYAEDEDQSNFLDIALQVVQQQNLANLFEVLSINYVAGLYWTRASSAWSGTAYGGAQKLCGGCQDPNQTPCRMLCSSKKQRRKQGKGTTICSPHKRQP